MDLRFIGIKKSGMIGDVGLPAATITAYACSVGNQMHTPRRRLLFVPSIAVCLAEGDVGECSYTSTSILYCPVRDCA